MWFQTITTTQKQTYDLKMHLKKIKSILQAKIKWLRTLQFLSNQYDITDQANFNRLE